MPLDGMVTFWLLPSLHLEPFCDHVLFYTTTALRKATCFSSYRSELIGDFVIILTDLLSGPFLFFFLDLSHFSLFS